MSRRGADLRAAGGQLVHAVGRGDSAAFDLHALSIVDAEGFVGGDVHVLQQHALDRGLGQAPDQARAAALRGGGGDALEGEVVVSRRALAERLGGVAGGDLGRKVVQVAVLLVGGGVGGVDQ